MRIQHNIPAMNSLTNYTRNNNALAGNLEKLSSGYRINSAADDAAGLAISEKMRSQIKGLEKAYDNANDGISLVQTAEGALTEVNSMLTRLTELATQSANGTYQDEVDRVAIQEETDAILDEIDRISKATNFNGINLLDGTLGMGSASGTSASLPTVDIAATQGTFSMNTAFDASGTVAVGDVLEYIVDYTDNTGAVKQATVSFEITNVTGNLEAKDKNGNSVTLKSGGVTATAGEMGTAIMNALYDDKEFAANFTIAENGGNTSNGKLDFTAIDGGSNGAKITGVAVKTAGATTKNLGVAETAGVDSFQAVDLSKAVVWDGKADTLEKSVFEINGEKFAFIANGTTLTDAQKDLLAEAGVGNNYVIMAAAGTSPAAADVKSMANIVKTATGLEVSNGAATKTNGKGTWTTAGATPAATDVWISLKGAAASNNNTGKGLVLQIGDTNDEFQKVTVSIDDMSSKGIGIAGLDLSKQDLAGDAIETIKNAVNTVSAQRGRLGALQNRLDHTLNNLDATTENITSAESQIRDVNMAKEMTAYTKNNILAQAAQSMLAQANSMPQGVLQLLQ